MRFIALGLYAPDARYVRAKAYRKFLNLYVEEEYAGRMEVWGYFTLIRPYPDNLDRIHSDWSTPKLYLSPARITSD